MHSFATRALKRLNRAHALTSREIARMPAVGNTTRALSTTAERFEFLTREQHGSALWVTIDRPSVHNAFNEHVIEEITRAFQTAPVSFPSAKAVVLTGAGASFSAGADMNWMKKMASYSQEENQEDSLKLFDMVHAIQTCPLPTVARINGAALGGGAGLVSACDIGLSIDKAVFGFTEVQIGLIPAVISGFVTNKIGKSNSSRYFLTGERFGGQRAQQIGLVSESFETIEELDAAVEGVVKNLSRASPAAVSRAKQLIEEIDGLTVANTRPLVSAAIAAIRVSEEGQEGLQAFLEKRKPSWISK